MSFYSWDGKPEYSATFYSSLQCHRNLLIWCSRNIIINIQNSRAV